MEFLLAVFVFGLLAAGFGALLGFASVKYKVEGDPLVEQIDALLPQTQCGQCGYPGCKPYAKAVADGDSINKCAPGGEDTIKKIADLMGVEAIPLDEAHEADATPKVAFIIEEDCIGCTKCIQACPVDAITGAAKQMHTIIADECTGCDLCVEPCPVDCIKMIPIEQTPETWQWDLESIDIVQID
ncbi:MULTISPECIES: electron transport complex subunit RsxB [unclassified Thalassotalea]|uniref:electron transport complex subunit RsxB n=1 Tax=unclassified Thalassotalea TaxID=2614972 RepID=UPI0010803998|nr:MULTISPECIES: electron transport complex subunit RsxB [unclassified Thalassotalea]NMP15636.1 electron transport complex subunit RsxB [Thalassotalea sp. Y01]QBY05720.1 electron transport complex subunit RsxB [Thalassotalea sp. HSM 43]